MPLIHLCLRPNKAQWHAVQSRIRLRITRRLIRAITACIISRNLCHFTDNNKKHSLTVRQIATGNRPAQIVETVAPTRQKWVSGKGAKS